MAAAQEHTRDGVREASTLRDYVSVVRRRKWVIVQAIVIVPAVAVFLSLRQDPLYRSSAEVLLSQNLALTLVGADAAAPAPADRVLATQARLAEGPLIARRTLRALDLEQQRPVRRFMRNSTIGVSKNTDILTFAVDDADFALAPKLANMLAQQYITYRRSLDTTALKRAQREVAARITELERRGDRDSASYASLVVREQELATAASLQNSNASLSARAGPAQKVSPRPKRNAALGLGLGLVLGLGLAFLLEALDTRIRTSDQIGKELDLPLLSRIPAPARRLQRDDRLVMDAQPSSPDAEAFRVLRTNFDFFNMEHGARTVMVTSAVSEEGKSTTIANLAIALARAGRRVILVDLDLRRPIIGRFFGFQGQPGVTDIALGRARLDPIEVEPDETLQRTARGDWHGSLEVLTSGPPPRSTGEFVGSVALEQLLERLRERADIVLVDAPPLLLVGDGIALAAKVDAMIVVARLGVVRQGTLSELRRILDACPATQLGYVITGAELEEGANYGYAQRYGYEASPTRKTTR